MAEQTSWLQNAQATSTDTLQIILGYVPFLLGAIGIMLVGWLAAFLVRLAIIRAAAGLDSLLRNLGQRTASPKLRMTPGVSLLLGNISFWVVLLVFAALAAQVGRLDTLTGWLESIVAYLPTLFAGGLITLAGFLLGRLVRDIVVTAAKATAFRQGELLGFIAQSIVFVTAVVIGLDQVGIDVTFLITELGIIIGTSLLALALAFGFGARTYVGNLIGAQQARQFLHQGETLRIGEIEGQIVEVSSTSIVLLTEEGRVNIPAKLLQEQSVLIVAEDHDE